VPTRALLEEGSGDSTTPLRHLKLYQSPFKAAMGDFGLELAPAGPSTALQAYENGTLGLSFG